MFHSWKEWLVSLVRMVTFLELSWGARQPPVLKTNSWLRLTSANRLEVVVQLYCTSHPFPLTLLNSHLFTATATIYCRLMKFWSL